MSKKYDSFDKKEIVGKVVRCGNGARVGVPKKWMNKKVLVRLLENV
jgi:putative transposon-encoded protein